MIFNQGHFGKFKVNEKKKNYNLCLIYTVLIKIFLLHVKIAYDLKGVS